MLMGNLSPHQAKPLVQGGSPYNSILVAPAGPSHASPYASQSNGLPGAGTPPASFFLSAAHASTAIPAQVKQVYAPAASHRSHETQGQSAECKGAQCKGAEAECTNQDECGGDEKGPVASETVCGIDKKPLLPLGLGLSTLLSGICMIFVEIPLLQKICFIPEEQASILFYSILTLYGLTLALGWYCAIVDAGQLSKRSSKSDQERPKRSHKTWLYERPVRRFDHYCRWLTNGIGLLNHREFVIMVTGLLLISILGVVDSLLIFQSRQHLWGGDMSMTANLAAVILHLLCSMVLFYLVLPILRLHVGFISRNELAKEFNKDVFRVLRETSDGRKNVPVAELSDEEFNEWGPEDFVYAPEKNPFDRGWVMNCFTFWCHRRWHPNETGDF